MSEGVTSTVGANNALDLRMSRGDVMSEGVASAVGAGVSPPERRPTH